MKNISFKNIVIIVSVSIFCGLLYNYFSSKGIPIIREKIELERDSSIVTNFEYPSIKLSENKAPLLIDAKTAYKYFDNGNAIFIDARDKWDYGEGHIRGALNFPEYRIDMELDEINKLDKSKIYIVYCGSEDCDLSTRVAMQFSSLGFNNIKVMEDGWEAWLRSGYPINQN